LDQQGVLNSGDEGTRAAGSVAPVAKSQRLLGFWADRPVVVQCSAGRMTSDAGLLPLAQFDRRWQFTERMAVCIADSRQDPEHSVLEMIRQRLYGIIADYEDCNDHDDLRDDPLFQQVIGKVVGEGALASQPTLSRFENSITPQALQQLIDLQVTTGIERLKQYHQGQLPTSLTLDIDPTDDPTHGRQQLALFHGYYEQHQYFPLLISEPTTKHMFLGWLRPGTVHAALGAEDDLLRVVQPLLAEYPDMTIHVRGDCGFGLPKMYQVCEDHQLTYTFGLATNNRLKKLTADLVARAAQQHEATGEKQRLFTHFEYQADSWDRPRMVVAKAEHQDAGTNLRFVVTNLPVTSDEQAEQRYDDYIQRGESEQRFDELKNGLEMGRLSCHRFMANFWRLLLHVAAYNLLNAFRDAEETPAELRHAQPAKWRSKLFKVAAKIVMSTRRVLVELPTHWPHWSLFEAMCQRVEAFIPYTTPRPTIP
jgi:hypothetical protein